MPDISRITLPSGITYNIKDSVARASISGGIQLKGTTTTVLTDESTTNPIRIDGELYTAVSQDAVFYGKKEFIFDGTKWHEFGDMSGLGDLAVKDNASGDFTPSGSISAANGSDSDYTFKSVTGTAASCTFPSLATSRDDDTLVLTWTNGHFTSNVPTKLLLPGSAIAASNIKMSFTGEQDAITVS